MHETLIDLAHYTGYFIWSLIAALLLYFLLCVIVSFPLIVLDAWLNKRVDRRIAEWSKPKGWDRKMPKCTVYNRVTRIYPFLIG